MRVRAQYRKLVHVVVLLHHSEGRIDNSHFPRGEANNKLEEIDFIPVKINNSQISTCPLKAAQWSAVVKFDDLAVRSAPQAKSISQRDLSPLAQAARKGVIFAELA